jgi:LmbE family N-acetylglucosaminyl deacetylase
MAESYRGLEAFDETKRVLVVSAHADDMETLMGGTLALLTARGVEVVQIICTIGDLGSNEPQWTRESLAATRVSEASAGATRLGVGEVQIMGHHDGELVESLALRAEIARYYRLYQPDTVFTFDPGGWLLNHPDHRAAGRAALDALIPASMRLYHPEQLTGELRPADVKRVVLWVAQEPNVMIDVGGVYDQKMAACLAHHSQFPDESRLEWMRRRDREAGERLGVEYAESFLLLAR